MLVTRTFLQHDLERILLKYTKIIEKIVQRNVVSGSQFHIKRAVVLSKMTRYEVEQYSNPNLSKAELEKQIRLRGSCFDSLMEHHHRHKCYEQYVIETFKDKGLETKVLKKSEYTSTWIDWCDAVFPVGGDGTFLLAASRIRQNTKPVIGLNSDPDHSEGYLCLPKDYSNNVKNILQKIEEGTFSWLLRTRIRVTVKSKEECEPLCHLQGRPEKFIHGTSQISVPSEPVLALNEVFIGERLSAQVSYLEIQLSPTGERTRLKSSGMCLTTGTGSSAWHMSINRLTPQCVDKVLRCAGVNKCDSHVITSKYNDALLFNPEEDKICYTIRELICSGVWPSPPGMTPYGFAQAVWVRSRCQDARLNIDGGTFFPFNDGSQAFFTLHPEDTLRTVVF